jgi:hypothetical protein
VREQDGHEPVEARASGPRSHGEAGLVGRLAERPSCGELEVELLREAHGGGIAHGELVCEGCGNAAGEKRRGHSPGEHRAGPLSALAGVEHDQTNAAPDEQAPQRGVVHGKASSGLVLEKQGTASRFVVRSVADEMQHVERRRRETSLQAFGARVGDQDHLDAALCGEPRPRLTNGVHLFGRGQGGKVGRVCNGHQDAERPLRGRGALGPHRREDAADEMDVLEDEERAPCRVEEQLPRRGGHPVDHRREDDFEPSLSRVGSCFIVQAPDVASEEHLEQRRSSGLEGRIPRRLRKARYAGQVPFDAL